MDSFGPIKKKEELIWMGMYHVIIPEPDQPSSLEMHN